MLQLRSLGHGIIVKALKHNEFGKLEAVTLYDNKRKVKKELKGLGPIQKILRRTAKSERNFIDTYLERHDKSRKKKRSGWLRDMPINVIKAQRKAVKKLYSY
jgi:hypothetical protein